MKSVFKKNTRMENEDKAFKWFVKFVIDKLNIKPTLKPMQAPLTIQ